MQIPVVTHSRLVPELTASVFQAPEATCLACTDCLSKCASSELFALEDNPVLCVLVCVILQMFIYNGEEHRANLNVDSGPHNV